MSIGTNIIQRALQKIGAHAAIAPASPASIELGMEVLNSMLELWLSRNIQIGFTPLEAPGDELNEPPDTTNAIISNLAMKLGPDFDNGATVVSPDLRASAASDFDEIRKIYKVITVPSKVVSSTLPTGQGNQRWGWNANYYPKGSTIGN